MRIHMGGYRMSMDQADILEYYLKDLAFVQDAKVYDETGDALITYKKTEKYRGQLLEALCTPGSGAGCIGNRGIYADGRF